MRSSGIRSRWPRLEASAEPICTIGPSRPTEPPTPMHSAEATALTMLTWGLIRPQAWTARIGGWLRGSRGGLLAVGDLILASPRPSAGPER